METTHSLRKPAILLAVSAMFAAMVTVTTAYLFHIPIGSNGGYIHVGDAFIYLAAAFLPLPYAAAASAVGAALADVLTGAAVYAIPTLIIKALMVVPFTYKGSRVISRRNVLAVIISGILCTVGYLLVDGLLFGTWQATWVTIWPGLVQSGGSAVVFLALGAALDKAGVKPRLTGGWE